MNKKKLIQVMLFTVCLSFITCSKSDNDPQPNSAIGTTTTTTTANNPTPYTTYIYYKNSSGQDLLDPNTSGYFSQRAFDVTWFYDNKTIVFTEKVEKNSSDTSLPQDYCFTIKDNDSTWGLMKFISFNKYPYKTDTLTFTYNGTVLEKLTYNKINIDPPSGMTAFPAHIPIVILK
jgi:hypothetical protein